MADESTSLYERIGGEKGIEKLVDQFYDRVFEDQELKPFFEHAEKSRLLAMQKEFFSEALGGPLFYSGHSLREVHAGRGIKKAHLRRFMSHLLAVLEDHQEEFHITRVDIDGMYNRIALEADEISGGGSEAG